ncbi:MAG: Ig-like domain-containing protein [Gemmatimonadales bacterium]
MSRLIRGTAPRVVLLGLAALGCARMGAPPGGPPDFTPPRLVATSPDSLAVRQDFDGWASFTFDEIISEGGTPNFGTGQGALEQLVIISPDSGVPRVRWRRERLEVQPRQGWRANTVYRIEFAPGLQDLRNNRLEEAITLTFTTGAPAPTRVLRGRAVDWVGRRFVPGALVTATYLPDSLTYRTLADSSGRFVFGPLPDGEVLVTVAIEDGRGDRLVNPTREAWDTVRLAAGRDSVGEVWAFARDTVPPRMGQGGTARVDSFGIALTLSQPIDPALRLGPDAVRVLLASDSSSLGVVSAFPEAVHDSIYAPIDSARRAQFEARREAARTDSLLAARADSLGIPRATLDSIIADSLARLPEAAPVTPPPARPPLRTGADTTAPDEPLEPRPPLGNRLVIRLSTPLAAGSRYLIEVRGVRAMSGQVADTIRTQLITQDAPKPAVDSSAADSVDAPAPPPDPAGTPPGTPTPPPDSAALPGRDPRSS